MIQTVKNVYIEFYHGNNPPSSAASSAPPSAPSSAPPSAPPRCFNLQIAEMNLTSQQLDHEESRKCFKKEKRPDRLFYVHDDEVAFIFYLFISPILYYCSFYMSLN